MSNDIAHANQSRRGRSFFRFRLSTLLVFAALFAILFVAVNRWLDSRPIQFVPYTTKAFEKQLHSGSPTVVFVGADWDLNSLVVKETVFKDQALRRLVRRRSVVAFYADLTSKSPEAISFLKRVDRNSTPTLVVYSKDTRKPVVMSGFPTAKSVISAIRAISDVEIERNSI